MNTAVLVVILSLALSAFFSAVELAFISANKLHVTLQKNKGKLWANIIARYYNRPSWFITAMLIGNTITLVVYGIYMAQILDPQVMYLVGQVLQIRGAAAEVAFIVIQSLLSTMLVLAVAEFMPKSISLINPDKLLAVFALPIHACYLLLYPFVYVVVNLTKWLITSVLRLQYSEDNPVFGLTDLNHYIDNLNRSQNTPANIDTKIFSNALAFKTLKVRDCMRPRTEIVAVDREDGLAALKKAFIETGHSKIFVYDQTIDNIIGYCHAMAMFKKPKSIDEILSTAIMVPETMPANELMVDFIAEQKSIAVVIDEFGGTAGVVSIEDIMEEIFGEIHDEFDVVQDDITKINNNTYILSARLEIDYINDYLQWNLPTGDYDTLGGYLISIVENIPKQGDVVETEHFVFTILSTHETRINKVRVDIKDVDSIATIRPVL
ncbi:MAG: hemolysin family protein [Cytophagales bacterium]|nr:hemolysin family protein [Bernardetiaceae bacterium]MDW8203397.1 hemolysin family protein [Cytophagales bacterium]